MTNLKLAEDAARKQREIEHHRKISENAGETWGWTTPAGRQRVLRRVELFRTLGRLEPNSKVLELGCGVGIFSEEYGKLGINLTAIDLSPDLLKQANQRIRNNRITFLLQDAENLDFPDESFDAVIGTSILHHLRVETALTEIYRVLRKNGHIVFSEPNMVNPQVWMERNIPSIRKSSGTSPDETAFVRWDMRKKLMAAGFTNVSVKPFDFLHPRTPEFAIPFVRTVGQIVENVPVMREISGSLLITAGK